MEILVKVVPWSKKIQITKEWKDLLSWKEIYKVNLTAKPIKGSANEQLQEVLANYFWVKKRFVKLVKWSTNRLKLVCIEEK